MEVWSWPSLPIDRSKVRKKSVALCRVFDLKFNGIHLAQVIIKHTVVYGQNIINVPICETEMPIVSLQLRAKTYRFCFIWVSARRGTQFCSYWNADYLLENLSRKNQGKCCLPEARVSIWCHLQSTFFFSVPSQNMLLREPIVDFCICGYRFWKWRSSE